MPEKGTGELSEWKLDDESKQRVEKFKSLFTALPMAALAKKLELLSSVLFLVKTGQGDKANPVGITATLHKHGKKFTQDEVIGGIQELARYGLAA